MADKSFGVKQIDLLGSGTPTIQSPNNINLNANTVAVSTNFTVGNKLSITSAGIVTAVSGVVTYFADPANSNAQVSWHVTANGSSAYRFTGPGQDGADDNPDIYLVRGQRYIFTNHSGGSHPFQIRVASGGAAYNTGVTNNGAAGGNIIFNVQHDAPSRLYYQCTAHGGMVGTIYIIGGEQFISGILTATTFSGSGSGLTNLPAGNLTGALPAIDGSALTNLPGISTEGGSTFNHLRVTGISTFESNIVANGNIVGDNSTNITGIAGVTASTFSGDGSSLTNLSIPGISTTGTSNFNDLTVTGNVSIGGTLTYEDVTSIDSIGIITARQGIHAGAGVSATGIVTATTFSGSGASLTSLPAGQLTGTLPAIDGSNLTGTKFSPDADQNLFAGTDAGSNLDGTSGCFNIFLGSCAGKSATSGHNNIFMGVGAGCSTTSGCCNIFIGRYAGKNLFGTSLNMRNVFIGQEIGEGCGDSGFTSGNNIRDNVFIGSYAGKKMYEGYGNIALGRGPGKCLTSGIFNIMLGCGAGGRLENGACNVFLGFEAGGECTSSASRNVAIGHLASAKLCSGQYNVSVGMCAGGAAVASSGNYNLSLGFYAGCCLTSGSQNILLGTRAGQQHRTGQDNIFMGLYSGCATNSGNYNVAIGANTMIGTGNKACNVVVGQFAGCRLTSGCSNVFLGYGAGRDTCTGDCNIAIGPSVCLASCNGDGQLAIGCDTSRWIVGDSSFNTCLGNSGNIKAMVTGTMCATAFVGDGANLTNLPTGINTGGTSTFNELVVNGDITANGNIVGDNSTNISGISSVTASTLYGDGSNLTGITAAGTGAIGGLTVKDEGSTVGTAGSVSTINFVGDAVVATASPGAAGVSTVTITGSFPVDSYENLIAGTEAGAAVDNDTCYSVILGYRAAKAWCDGSGSFGSVYIGMNAGCALHTGNYNTLIGNSVGKTQTSGSSNTYIGRQIMDEGTNSGSYNIYMGEEIASASSNTTGSYNLSVGYYSHYQATSATFNIAIGSWAGHNVTTGGCNLFIGKDAGKGDSSNYVTGSNNTAVGAVNTGLKITSGTYNALFGARAGMCLTSGSSNTFIGHNAGGGGTTTGDSNVAVGRNAGNKITSGAHNIFLGSCAGCFSATGNCNIAIGAGVTFTACNGSGQMAIGVGATHFIFGDSSYNVTLAGIATVTKSTGVVEATKFCGDGSCLSGVGFKADAQENLYAGTTAGNASDADTSYNIALGYKAGYTNCAGDNNVILGCCAAYCLQSGNENIAIGDAAGKCLTTGISNIFLGKYSGQKNTTGSCNIFLGRYIGSQTEHTGNLNVFIGRGASEWNTSGSCNISIGCGANRKNSTGTHNIALGSFAMQDGVTTGSNNIAFGQSAGLLITSGQENIAIGCKALGTGTVTGQQNITIGHEAGGDITSGSYNILFGRNAARGITSASGNIVMGTGTLGGDSASTVTTGSANIVFGELAARAATSAECNVLIGSRAGKCVTSGSKNVFLGNYSGASNAAGTGCQNIAIGFRAAFGLTSGCDNVVMGTYAGTAMTEGKYNVVLGRSAGCRITTALNNVVLGLCAGQCITTQGCQVFIGVGAGQYSVNAQYNTFIGHYAGRNSTACNSVIFGCYAGACGGGNRNIVIGNQAGCKVTDGDNVILGTQAGMCMTSASRNIAIGQGAMKGNGSSNVLGDDNIAIGFAAGCCLTSGCFNVFLGKYTACTLTTGCYNVAIGCAVQLPSATGSCQLAIGAGTNRWIAGDSGFNVTVATASTFRSTGAHITGVLTATSFVGDGSLLTNLPASGGAGDKFNTGITSSIQANIKGYETDVITFGPDNTKRYVIDSISVANVTSGVGSTVNVTASINPGVTTYSSETKVYLAYNVPVPDNGLVELLKQPMVMNPSDVVKVWASDSSYGGVNDALELYASYQEQESTDFVAGYGSTVGVANTDLTTIYTSTSNPTVLQSIKLTNRTDAGDFPVTVQLVNGSTATHLAKNLVVPRYASIEILDRPKRLETGGTVKVQTAAAAGTIDVIVSGKKIT